MKKYVLLLIIIFYSIFLCSAQKRLNKEVYYQNAFAKIINGKTEYVLDDKTRVDILTDKYAFEVDFANNWAEAIGQSLYYSIKTKKKAAILLIIEDFRRDNKYLNRVKTVAIRHNISIYIINDNLDWNRIKN